MRWLLSGIAATILLSSCNFNSLRNVDVALFWGATFEAVGAQTGVLLAADATECHMSMKCPYATYLGVQHNCKVDIPAGITYLKTLP